MRVKAPARQRETPYWRRARSAASSAALCVVIAGCADLLDIPEHPRLVSDTAAPARPARVPDAALERGFGGAAGAGARAVASGAEEGLLPAPPLDDSRASPRGTPSANDPDPELLPDAGPSGVSPAPFDAGAPPLQVGETPALVCAASGVLGPDGSCYAALATLRPWAAARQRCRALGAGWDLASVRNVEVNRFLTDGLSGEAWLGASDSAQEGTWIWIDDGTVFWNGSETGAPVDGNYANWAGTEPNGEAGSACARLVPENSGAWADLECEELRGAVCKGPPR